MEKLLKFFIENKVAIQITLDLDKNPTVHALFDKDGERLHKTEHNSLIGALESMKEILFN